MSSELRWALIGAFWAAISAGLFGFCAGVDVGRRSCGPKETVQTQTKGDTQIQVVDHVVTRVVTKTVKEPGGTVVRTVIKEVAADKTKEQEKTTQQTTATVTQAPQQARPDWSVEVDWTPRLSPAAEYPTSLELGYRVLGPAWLTGGFDWHDHSPRVGVRLEL